MSARTHIYAVVLGISLISAQACGQEQANPVQKLIQQYEAMPDKERVAFLQAIALIGIQKPPSAQPVVSAQEVSASPQVHTTGSELASLPNNPAQAAVQGPPTVANAPTTPNPPAVPLAKISLPTVLEESSPTVDVASQSAQGAPAAAQLQAKTFAPALVPAPGLTQTSALPISTEDAKSPDKPVTTVQITLPEPAEPNPDDDIQAVAPPAPSKLLDMPTQPTPSPSLATSADKSVNTEAIAAVTPTPSSVAAQTPEPIIAQHTKTIENLKTVRVITSQQMEYGYPGSTNPTNSVFGLLLPEYQQKLNNSGVKIEIDDLRKETIKFYVTSLEGKITDCGYQVTTNTDASPAVGTALQLDTGIQRIVINKTLFETAMIGEANATLSANSQDLSIIQSRATKALKQFDNASLRTGELKTNLGLVIEELSTQVANKLCKAKPN